MKKIMNGKVDATKGEQNAFKIHLDYHEDTIADSDMADGIEILVAEDALLDAVKILSGEFKITIEN